MRRRHLESVSSRSLSVKGSWGTAPSVFWFLLYAQKERPGGEPYRLCTLHILRDAEGEMKLWHNLCHQSLRLISFATSLCTREAFADRRLPTWSRISSAAHSSANRSPAPQPPRPLSPQIHIIIPSLTSPIKPTIYAILAQ